MPVRNVTVKMRQEAPVRVAARRRGATIAEVLVQAWVASPRAVSAQSWIASALVQWRVYTAGPGRATAEPEPVMCCGFALRRRPQQLSVCEQRSSTKRRLAPSEKLLWRRSGRGFRLVLYFVRACAGGMSTFVDSFLGPFFYLVPGFLCGVSGGMGGIFGVLFHSAVALWESCWSKSKAEQEHGREFKVHSATLIHLRGCGVACRSTRSRIESQICNSLLVLHLLNTRENCGTEQTPAAIPKHGRASRGVELSPEDQAVDLPC